MEFALRWMLRGDMTRVMEIEAACFSDDSPWAEEDFLSVLRDRNCIGMVVEDGRRVVGFMIYELQKTGFKMLHFAVDPKDNGRGVGTAMIEAMKEKLANHKLRDNVAFLLNEYNVGMQLFLRHCGFICAAVMQDDGVSAYEFVWRLQWASTET